MTTATDVAVEALERGLDGLEARRYIAEQLTTLTGYPPTVTTVERALDAARRRRR